MGGRRTKPSASDGLTATTLFLVQQNDAEPRADLVREHADELLKLQALDNSVPLSFGEIYAMSADFVADAFDHHAGWVDKLAGETLPPYQGGETGTRSGGDGE